MRLFPSPELERIDSLGIPLQYQFHIEEAYIVTKINHPNVFNESSDKYYKDEPDSDNNDEEGNTCDEEDNNCDKKDNVQTHRCFKDIVTIENLTGHICHQTSKFIIFIPCQSMNKYMDKYYYATRETIKKYGKYF